jgi:two-component system response regulator MprA
MPIPLYILIAAHNRDIKTVLARLIPRIYPLVAIGIADNGADALGMIDYATPDLLITDYRMPVLDGLTLARRLRARQATFPILAMSVDRALEREALAAGATRFLLKPFPITALYQVIDELLHRVA